MAKGSSNKGNAAKAKRGLGRNSPFTKEQDRIIETHIPAWHDYAFIQHPDSGGRGKVDKLTTWKQERAREIMQDPSFGDMSEVSLTFLGSVIKLNSIW